MESFLYPTSRQFPFDEVCDRIVGELEARNWDVPGVLVAFSAYGSGDEKFRHVREIKGLDFRISFGRVQGLLGTSRQWSDVAGVTRVSIPGKEINVYEDESGPTFNLYVGRDWEKDREAFFGGFKVNSKYNGEPRLYLQYKGNGYGRVRPPFLNHTNDLGRQYDPEGDEPQRFRTHEVLEELKNYLIDNVLSLILAHPVPAEKVDKFTAPKALPVPEGIGPIFCFCEDRDIARIRQGRVDPSKVLPAQRYGMTGSGLRLVPLGTRSGVVPEVAYDGFLWCGLGEATWLNNRSLVVPGHTRWEREVGVVEITLANANDVYIADHAAYEKRRKEIAEATTGRNYFTDSEISDFVCTRARTIVPLSDYKGGYEQPIVLVDRELTFEEVRLVGDRI
jgi:hypothetical protein